MRRALLLVVLLLAAGCSGGGDDSASAGPDAAAFAYDEDAPLDARTRVVAESGAATVEEVSFATPSGRVEGQLIDGGGDGETVVFLHGRDVSPQEVAPLAAQWAGHAGGRALVLATAATPEAASRRAAAASRREATVASVVRVRRALDWLDEERVGLVALRDGVPAGAIAAVVDPRIEALAVVSGGATALADYLAGTPEEEHAAIEEELRDVDALRWIERAEPGSVFFQLGSDTGGDGARDERALLEAAGEQKVERYDGGHELEPRAWEEQREWLAERLGGA